MSPRVHNNRKLDWKWNQDWIASTPMCAPWLALYLRTGQMGEFTKMFTKASLCLSRFPLVVQFKTISVDCSIIKIILEYELQKFLCHSFSPGLACIAKTSSKIVHSFLIWFLWRHGCVCRNMLFWAVVNTSPCLFSIRIICWILLIKSMHSTSQI